MKKVSLLVLTCMIASILLVSLASCDHAHEFGTDWVIDKDNHYHVCATCGEKSDSAAHADANNDEACDTCGVKMGHSVHNYGEAWAYDATNHYHVCDECNANSDSAAHADADNDGACDVCKVIMTNSHVYASIWTASKTEHWHAPICGHDVAPIDKAAHDFNAIGDCTVCGFVGDAADDVDVSTVAKALEAAKLAQSKVAFGTVTVTSWGMEMPVSFSYGEDYLYTYDSANDYQTFVTKLADDDYFYVKVSPSDMNSMSVMEGVDAKYFAGPEVNLANAIDSETMVYGAVELLDFFLNVYPAMFEEAPDITTNDSDWYGYEHTFEYTVTVESQWAYMPDTVKTFSVSFLLGKGYNIEELTVTVDSGSGYPFIVEYAQSVSPVNNYRPETVIPTEVAINDAEGNPISFTDGKANAINMGIATYTFGIEVVAPDTATLAAFGEITASVTGKDGEVLDSYVGTYFNSNDGTLSVYFKDGGEYEVHIALGEDTYVVPFNISWSTPTSITPVQATEVSGYMGPETAVNNVQGNINAYIDGTVTIGAAFADGCDPKAFTAAITSDNAATATLSAIYTVVDTYGDEYYMLDFSASAAGTYTVTFTSTVDETVTATVTIVVSEPPAIDEVATGKWTYSGENNYGETITIVVNFHPTDATKGAIVVDWDVVDYWGAVQVDVTILYTYSIEDGEFVSAYVSGDDYSSDILVEINDAYSVTFDGNVLTRTATEPDAYDGELPVAPGAPAEGGEQGGEVTDSELPAGTYAYEDDPEWDYLIVTPADTTTGTIEVHAGYFTTTYDYEVVDGVLNITYVSGAQDGCSTLTLNDDGTITMKCVGDPTEYVLVLQA